MGLMVKFWNFWLKNGWNRLSNWELELLLIRKYIVLTYKYLWRTPTLTNNYFWLLSGSPKATKYVFLTYKNLKYYNFNFRSAEQRKEEGNQLYKNKKYAEALQKYSQAIELCPDNPAFYGNRAACHMMLSQYNKALDDAKTTVGLDSDFVKGYVRIAKCCIALGEISSAKQVMAHLLGLV